MAHIPGPGTVDDDDYLRLIDAAPALLEALKKVMGWIDNWHPNFAYDDEWPADRDEANAAIAAATGEVAELRATFATDHN